MTPEKPVYIPPEGRGLTEEEDQVRKNIGKLGGRKSEWKHFTPQFVGTKVQSVKLTDLVKQINRGAENFEKSMIEQPKGWVEIKTNLPISIAHLGDLHLGSIYTDTNEVLRKMKEVVETPNMYCVFMANLIDNAIPAQYPDSMLANAIPPHEQIILMRSLAEKLNAEGKILGAVVSPCHEGWSWKVAGQDINALIFGFEGRKFPVLENGGELYVKVGKQAYLGALYHQVGPFESQFNETHALRQLNRLQLGMRADWIAAGHKHYAAAQISYEDYGDHRKPVAYLRTGTEKGTGKIHDKWANERYGHSEEPTGQMIHLWPNGRKIEVSLDFDTGLLAHECFYLTEMAKK
jgi:hypothetical protein